MQTSAEVILDSVHPNVPAARITTIKCVAPRYLLAEINTHGLLAKSAASSRAIPVAKRIEMVSTDPFVPMVFGANRPGMQSTENLAAHEQAEATDAWKKAAWDACDAARYLNRIGVHKQQANRLLEPFVYVTGLLTATEWDNFFKLRDHADADPEFQKLASAIRVAMENSTPMSRKGHRPFVGDSRIADADAISAARCARISYTTFDGKTSTAEQDIKLARDLLTAGHMSPFDHVAYGDDAACSGDGSWNWLNPTQHGRFWGWIPYRNVFEKNVRRSSFDAFT